MKPAIFFGILLIAIIIGVTALDRETVTYVGSAPHHTHDGFRNPYPGFKKRGFRDFLKWMITERRSNGDSESEGVYSFERAGNDGAFLRANRSDFTVTWMGHSTVLVQLAGVNILTDPIWSNRASPVSWAGPKRYTEPGVAFGDLPEINVVLISHDHYDHLDTATLNRLGSRPLYLVPLGIGEFLEERGIVNYRELDWWDRTEYRGITFNCTPAQHFSGRGMFNRNSTLWCGWAVRGETQSFYFAGDSGYFPGFREIGERYGPFDLVCVPIGAYLPKWFMGPVHTNPAEAIRAFHDLEGRVFVPIHWGTFTLAADPPGLPPTVLLKEIQKRQLNGDDFWLLRHGETRNITQFFSQQRARTEESSLY